MKLRKIITLALGTACSLAFVSGCAAGMFEEEINVVFMNEGEVIDSGTVTQFQNYQSPTISDAYIPTNYKFLGWTPYSFDQLDLSSASALKNQYIAGGRMVHYKEAKPHAVNGTTTYNALILHKDEIPQEYHYAVVAWYDKAGTSGITADNMEWVNEHLISYLANDGVSKEDLDTVVVRGYSGNVGPSTGQILFDGDVDVMFGWGSVDNITTTGSIPVESIEESVPFSLIYNGETKNRYVHRISQKEGAIKVMNFFASEEVTSYFNQGA